MYPNLDVTLILEAMTTTGHGVVTLRDFTAFNLPPSRADYPLGLITALPWFAGLHRYAVQRCIIMGPCTGPYNSLRMSSPYLLAGFLPLLPLQQASVIGPSPTAFTEHDRRRT